MFQSWLFDFAHFQKPVQNLVFVPRLGNKIKILVILVIVKIYFAHDLLTYCSPSDYHAGSQSNLMTLSQTDKQNLPQTAECTLTNTPFRIWCLSLMQSRKLKK